MTPEKFWSRADRSGGPESCWTWQGTISPGGYGRYASVNGRSRFAHRLAYEPIPDGLPLDHLCRNTRCVNPVHLEPVTTRENVLRSTSPAALHAKKTHCPEGHEYGPERAEVHQARRRRCPTCHMIQQRGYYSRNRAKVIKANGEYRRAHRKAHNPKAEIAGDLAA